MDVVLVGLPGSGKSAVGRRLTARHGASFIDLDETIENAAGQRIAEIFTTEGEVGFRARERAAVEALGPPSPEPEVVRVIATGGGAVVDPRNRWRLYRGRTVIWLDGSPEALAQRLRHSPNPRPLVAGPNPLAAIRALLAARERFYAAGHRVNGLAPMSTVVEAVDAIVRRPAHGGTTLMTASTPIGRFVLCEGRAGPLLADELARLGAGRAVVVSEPGAWTAFGGSLSAAIEATGLTLELGLLPQGEPAKRLAVVESAARELARLRVERSEPLVAVGGGALGDTGGFLAATFLRGIPLVHVPTTLVAQLDSSIGGKTAVDLPEGKNLVGAFHQPAAVVTDISALRTLPERHRRAALAEAVKMAVLGDERLFELLEADGDAMARGLERAFEGGAVAELVERAAWAKVEIVQADERERGGAAGAAGTAAAGRLALNLGHSLGHAVEAAGGYEALLHGEAIAFGLRAAGAIGQAVGVTPPDRADRINRLLDRLELGLGRLPFSREAVRDHLAIDKKHAGGRLRWVLPTADGVVVQSDVSDAIVEAAMDGLLEPTVPSRETTGAGTGGAAGGRAPAR